MKQTQQNQVNSSPFLQTDLTSEDIVDRDVQRYNRSANRRFMSHRGVTHILSWHLLHDLQHGERYDRRLFFLKEEEKLQESDISSKQWRWSTLQSWGKSAHTKINTSYYSLPFHTYCIPAHFSTPDANTHMKNKCSSPGAGMNFRCENLWIGKIPRSMYCTWRSLNACVSV